jgi:hypothetical protein
MHQLKINAEAKNNLQIEKESEIMKIIRKINF